MAFKPTLTSGQQTFRPTRAGALAYFVGGDPQFPNDAGFAITPWTACAIRNQVVQLHGIFAVTMGNVDLTDSGRQDLGLPAGAGWRNPHRAPPLLPALSAGPQRPFPLKPGCERRPGSAPASCRGGESQLYSPGMSFLRTVTFSKRWPEARSSSSPENS